MELAHTQNHHISGYVEDSRTGERIIGAYVIDSLSKNATSTNNYGFFNIKITGEKAAIYSSYFGFVSEIQYFSLTEDTSVTIKIYPVTELSEVVIQSTQYTRDVNSPLGLSVIPVKALTLIPALGEPDLLKSIQSQPGIKGGVEGSAGIFVRGGGGGENLIMLDDVPIYNVSHLYGFFSAFNTSAVKDIKLLKGCFPARYGGRVSSVIDVRSLDGNNKSIKGETSVGLISSKFTLQGPLLSDKATFMVSGRRSYFDLFTEPLKKQGLVDNSFPNYSFYDLNARVAYTFSNHDRVFFSFYKGKDNIQTTTDNAETHGDFESFTETKNETSGWGNLISSFRWNHTFGKSLFSNATFAYSHYDYFTQSQYQSTFNQLNINKITERNYLANYTSTISDFIFKTDFDYSISNNHLLKFGIGITFHTYYPGANKYSMNDGELSEKTDVSYSNTIINASEPYIYIEDELKITKNTTINAGLRISGLYSATYKKIYPEPRLSANYAIHPQLSIKAGYSRMLQYAHLLSSYGLSMPTDIWVPALQGVKTLKSDQANIGFAYKLKADVLFSVELYRKWLYNTADYKNGSTLLASFEPWYNKITQGRGNAKGLELSIEKQSGKIKGSMNYTLSMSNRNYLELNNGQTFSFIYDRKHDFNISLNYQISEKWDISALWLFGSGYPVSIPVEKYVPALGIYNINSAVGDEIDYYPSLNNFRLPAYHRLDLSLHRKKQSRMGQHIWSLDVFNAYNRKNPIAMHFGQYWIRTIQYSYLLPLIPSITYTFKF